MLRDDGIFRQAVPALLRPNESDFPDPRQADDEGLVAIGGDYRPRTLLTAYARGIFPWPCEDLPLAWFSPNPRLVLRPEELRVPRSLRKKMKKWKVRVTYDTAFDMVILYCAQSARRGRYGTWLNDPLMEGLVGLHQLGLAHSVEVWRRNVMIGGLYGIALGTCFCGESMFFFEPDASKVAFVHLVERLRRWEFRMIDCQIYTDHLARFGAREWDRGDFLDELDLAIGEPSRRGPWTEVEEEEPANR